MIVIFIGLEKNDLANLSKARRRFILIDGHGSAQGRSLPDTNDCLIAEAVEAWTPAFKSGKNGASSAPRQVQEIRAIDIRPCLSPAHQRIGLVHT